MTLIVDKGRLAKDIIETFSRLANGKEFLGHDGRRYRLVYSDDKTTSKAFFDVVVQVDDGANISVGRYAVVLIGTPRC